MAPYLNHFTLLLANSHVYLWVAFTCNGSSLSHGEECRALFQFKQSVIHQDDEFCAANWFQTFHTWKPTSNTSDTGFDCCLWDGVECSNQNEYGHVIGLDLSESFLCGRINSTNNLFSLVHLQSLNLAMNDFLGSQIPSEIAYLNGISQLMHLSSLDLSRNPLKLHSPSLNNLVQNLTRLEELHLSGVDINSPIPRLLANFSSLRSIKLKDCLLWYEFPAAILELPKLRVLDVASNINLIGSFPEFHNNSLLEYVDLGLTGFFGILPESIRNLNHLMFLRLSGCSFSGCIPGSLSNLMQLTFLSLASNKFTSFVPFIVKSHTFLET